MTNDEFDQLLTALNIYNERGELEYFTGKVWVAWGGPLSGQFRIKPQPREVYILRAALSGKEHATTAWKLSQHSEKMFDSDYAKFREVLE